MRKSAQASHSFKAQGKESIYLTPNSRYYFIHSPAASTVKGKQMNIFALILSLCCLCLLNTQCAYLTTPQTIQQGNYLSTHKLQQLKLGMSKNNVVGLLGSPVVRNPFDNERWDYAFSIQTGSQAMYTRHIVLYFKHGKLSKIQGHYDQHPSMPNHRYNHTKP